MAMDTFRNLAFGAVQVPPVPPHAGTSLTMKTGQAARFPAPPFSVTIWPFGLPADPTNAEIVRVTAVAGDIWTIQRQQEGSLARTIEINDQVAQAMTVKTIGDLIADLKAYTDSKVAALAAQPKPWPVGSIFTAVTPTNPNALLGYGTWTPYGTGRVLVGVDPAQGEFASIRQTGGEKAHVLSGNEMPYHGHGTDAHAHAVSDPTHAHAVSDPTHVHGATDPSHAHSKRVLVVQDPISVGGGVAFNSLLGVQGLGSHLPVVEPSATGYGIHGAATGIGIQGNYTGISIQNATVGVQPAGASWAHNNLQPYITVYMWERTA